MEIYRRIKTVNRCCSTSFLKAKTKYLKKNKTNIKLLHILNISIHHAKNFNAYVGYIKMNMYWYYHVD